MSRRRLARVLDEAKVLRAMLALRSRFGSPWITVLTYHRVAEASWSSSVGGSLFDDGVIDSTPEELDQQLRFVRRHFDPITLDDLLAFRRGAPLPKNPVLVTFDDGYRDNHDVALPILNRNGIKAVFFVATSYIDERRVFWWDRINHALKSTRRTRIALDYPGPMMLELDSDVARSRAILTALRIVKHSFGLDLERFLAHLGERAEVAIDRDEERRFADDLLMTWDQIRELHRNGMAVQSHTVTHRVVQTLEAAPLAVELRESKAKLEAELGAKVRALAYPVGITLRFAPHVRRAVEDAGYELAFTNGNGINDRRSFDPYAITRLSPDYSVPDYQFRAMLTLPYFKP
jgi:peptidoglycan/xylan/chitin deacetylase (PgdA/CDA1 family)